MSFLSGYFPSLAAAQAAGFDPTQSGSSAPGGDGAGFYESGAGNAQIAQEQQAGDSISQMFPGDGGSGSGSLGLNTQAQSQLSAPAVSTWSPTDAALPTAPTASLAANAQLPVADYTNEVDQALQPTFNEQNQQLEEQLAAQGILTSGAGVNQLGNMTGQQSAAIASAVAPLIQQGNAEQTQVNLANSQSQNTIAQAVYAMTGDVNLANAAAQNAAASQNAAAANGAASTGYQGALSQLEQANSLSNQDTLANQSTQTEYDLANLGANTSLQQTQLSAANSGYQSLIDALYGINSSGQGASNTIASNGVGLGTSAYTGGQSGGAAPYINNIGATTPTGSGGVGAQSPTYSATQNPIDANNPDQSEINTELNGVDQDTGVSGVGSAGGG